MDSTFAKSGRNGTATPSWLHPAQEPRPRRAGPRGHPDTSVAQVARPCSRRREHGAATVSARDLREGRLNRIEAGKTKLWRGSLRRTQLVNVALVLIVGLIVIWQDWSFLGGTVGAVIATTGMWLFARRTAPTEERLRRHMLFLAAKRRTCAICGYRIHDLTGDKCPECGARFDPDDDRHMLRAPETLHIYSAQARWISAIVIVLAIFWSCALVDRSGWLTHAALALGGLAAFHALHALWIRRARTIQRRHGLPTSPRCPSCRTELALNPGSGSQLPVRCPGCIRPLTYGDLFVRPDARWLADRRVRRIQYRLLMLRWFFLVAVFIGLVVLTQVDPVVRRIASLGMGPVGLGLFVVFFVGGTAAVLRLLGIRLRRRLHLLFAQIEPQCEGCNAPITHVPIGGPCPACERPTSRAD